MYSKYEIAGGAQVKDLVGKTITKIYKPKDGINSRRIVDSLFFECSDGAIYIMHHEQDCCEEVRIEEIIGDLNDLIGNPVFIAEERSENTTPKHGDDSATWTFYEFATIKGSVTIRWYGESNGYYSEQADFDLVKELPEGKRAYSDNIFDPAKHILFDGTNTGN